MTEKKVTTGELVNAAASELGVDTNLPINEALAKADLSNALVSEAQSTALKTTVSQNGQYAVKQSILWTNLFWRIASDTIGRVIYGSKFSRFNIEMPMGGDLAEEFIRLKSPQDRTQLSNSDLLNDYIDDVDIAIHRINHLERFATTFLENEGRKVFQSWDTLQSFISAAIDNLQQSYNVNTDRQIMQMIVDGYAAGQIQALQLPTDSDTKAAFLNTHWDNFTIEASGDYVGWNLNSNASANELENISQNPPYLIIEAGLMRNIEFLQALNLYFTRAEGNNNDLFSRVIKVKQFPNPSPTITPDTGYTAVAAPAKIRAMFMDEDFLKYLTQFKITTDFQNAATLKSNVYIHYDNLLSFSPFKQAVVFTD